MDLSDIKAKTGIQIYFNNGLMGISFLGFNNTIIVSYQSIKPNKYLEPRSHSINIRNVKWNPNQSLEQLLESEFINIETITKVIDWTLEEDNIIYKISDITLSKDEIKDRLGMKYLIIQ